jgi:hypothetical protein
VTSFSLKALMLATTFATLSGAATMPGTVSGTCGFYQGSPSNVVYSESFSGNGTFCTGFMTGGFFTDTSSIQVGDIFAATSHSFSGTAPNGYTEFVTINTVDQVTQQYLFTPTVHPTTPTGTVYLSTSIVGGSEEGSTGGTCQEGVSLNNISNNSYTGGSLVFATTFGQPVNITETASLTCNLTFPYNSVGGQFSESGSVRLSGSNPIVLDANGNYVGMATYQVVTPEPAAALLVGMFGFPVCVVLRSRKFLK